MDEKGKDKNAYVYVCTLGTVRRYNVKKLYRVAFLSSKIRDFECYGTTRALNPPNLGFRYVMGK